MQILVIVVALTLIISAMCSLFEATLYSTRMATLEAARGEPKHRALAERFILMKKEIFAPTSAILILNTVANTGGATLSGMYAAQELGPSWVPLFSVGLTLGILLLSEIFPKTYGAIHWRTMWPLIVWPLVLMQKGLHFLTAPIQRLSRWLGTGKSVTISTEDEIVSMIRLGAQAGHLTPNELHLLSAVFRFDRVSSRQAMVPRGDIVVIDVNQPLEEALRLVQTEKHTRYPLCRGSLDDVLGCIHVKDLVGLASHSGLTLNQIARPLRAIPDTLPVSRLLREMQSLGQHMSLVTDEHGTVIGMITMENILEEIVGAVRDEFDLEAPQIVPAGSGFYDVTGTMRLEGLNRELRLDLYAPGVHTLSGLLVSELGRQLKEGDVLRLEEVTARVLEVRDGRAARIRLSVDRTDKQKTAGGPS